MPVGIIVKEENQRKSRLSRIQSDETPNENTLQVDERTIRRIARDFGPSDSLIKIAARQFEAEMLVRLFKKLDFRAHRNGPVCQAYNAMQVKEFEAVNARQSWANWRTIPRTLRGYLPQRPLRVIDLCCGTGESTEVLACYCPPGSEILGLEYSDEFVKAAREKEYLHRNGATAKVLFNTQSVLDPFRYPDGREVEPESIDLVNASGAIGCHFHREATERLAVHCAHVLRKGALAAIDSGKLGTRPEEVKEIFAPHGFHSLRRARSCIVDYLWQICMRKGEEQD